MTPPGLPPGGVMPPGLWLNEAQRLQTELGVVTAQKREHDRASERCAARIAAIFQALDSLDATAGMAGQLVFTPPPPPASE